MLGVKDLEALAKNPALMVVLDAEPLPSVQPSETLLQFFEDVLVHRGASAAPGFFGELKIHLTLLAHLLCAPQAKPAGSIRSALVTKIAANARRWIIGDRERLAKRCRRSLRRRRAPSRNLLASAAVRLYPILPSVVRDPAPAP